MQLYIILHKKVIYNCMFFYNSIIQALYEWECIISDFIIHPCRIVDL